MRGSEVYTHSINFENGQKPILPKRKVPAIINRVLTFAAIGSRLIICPGDDILAATVATTLGLRTSDTLREAVLPKPTEIILEEEDENRDKNKV